MPMKNSIEQAEYQRKWMAKRRAAYFADKCCARCKSTYNLEINHIDPTTKISHRIWSWSTERRNEELKKCEILCNPCHKDYTAAQREAPCGTRSAYRYCRCQLCKRASTEAKREYRARLKARSSKS